MMNSVDLAAELILISTAYLFLINSLIDLLQQHVEESAHHDQEQFDHERHQRNVTWVKYFAWYDEFF